MPRHWHAPAWWLRQAVCIHEHEGAWNSIGYVHGVATYGGGMQFMLSTWHRAGGSALSLWDIARTKPREQLYRAWRIWDSQDGRYGNGRGDWSEWGTARACGLR